MIYSRLMHVHIPRTAGTTFCTVLNQVAGLEPWEQSKHLSYTELKIWCEKHHRPVPPAVTFIRNPWDWYACMWAWTCRVAYKKFLAPFEDFMEIVRCGGGSRPFQSMTWYWGGLQADKAQYIGRYEDLYNEYARILVAIMPDLVTADTVMQIAEDVGWTRWDVEPNPWLSPERWGGRGPYWRFYNEKVQGWVAELDAGLIERFGYEFRK